MSGTRIGGLKTVKRIKQDNPNHYKEIGKIGGKTPGKPKGFAAMPKEKRQAAGKKGGSKSSRLGIKTGEGKKTNLLEVSLTPMYMSQANFNELYPPKPNLINRILRRQ